MLNTLCIETSSAYCSVALAADGQIFSRHAELKRQHNEFLLSMLDDLFEAAEGQLAGGHGLVIERVAFSNGPGSFTGIRLGAATAQAIALKDAAEVRGISSSKILAASYQRRTAPSTGQCLVTAVKSRGVAYYLAAFQVGKENDLTLLHGDELCTAEPDWFEALLASSVSSGITLVGECPPWLTISPGESDAEKERTAVSRTRILHDSSVSGPHAEAMLPLALALEAAPGALELPLYLEGDSPWRKQTG